MAGCGEIRNVDAVIVDGIVDEGVGFVVDENHSNPSTICVHLEEQEGQTVLILWEG